ncbi:FAD-dependent oxidoreductase [Paenibacillus sp. MER TA 81-3]|uniref:FAD-dependent oxidoreductase n=1 Tax=Paenibacillus sp. MER TA 81-3 TaxID=2939573 RepID=UPI002040613A|nr:FAD-dependent oxidoreductase [Paenibacillus sp. MER TA 81-3]MCM3342608.1 FAD-dependent oxidoreductase [Paenibacillus sp. MER TA 81-3]
MEKRIEEYDVVIIGGGAGGMTAAIYCGRARLKTLLIEKTLMGGLATYTNEIENYPGFPDGSTGIDLMKQFEKQAKRFGVKIKLTDVKGIVDEGTVKIVQTYRTDYKAKAVIIATGGKPRLTGATGEQDFLYDKGISFCATCDAARYTDQHVLIVGSGDAAIEEGLFLTKFARTVTVSVIHDEGVMDANKIAQEKALQNPKMNFIWNTVVDQFAGKDSLEKVILRNVKTNESIPVDVDGCFLFIGYVPNTELFKELIDLTPQGYIHTNEQMETNVSGIFAVGDVRNKWLRQVATAVGDGAIAGVAAERHIEESDYFETEILQKELPALVFCWDPRDAACRDLLPELDKVKAQWNNQLKVIAIDIYKGATLAERLGHRGAPAILAMRDGKVIQIYQLEGGNADFEAIAKDLVKS